jgi:hypothetical protein
MKRFLQFWWRCCSIAITGNSSFANSWQWMFGAPVVAVIAALMAQNIGVTTLTSGNQILDIFLAALAAFAITWLVAFWMRLLRAPVDLFYAGQEKVHAAEARLAAGAQPYPNWPIHELFSYIRPDLLERTDDEVEDTWEIVGNDIRDQASLGRLKIWGRIARPGLLGERNTLGLIEQFYWTDAFFTYSSFDATAANKPHTYLAPGRGGAEYTDLQVNRAGAMSIWPPDDMRRPPLRNRDQ